MYYRARYYDSTLGRFISADAIVPEPGNPQTLNRYAYVKNNPLRYVDPSGHISEIAIAELYGVEVPELREMRANGDEDLNRLVNMLSDFEFGDLLKFTKNGQLLKTTLVELGGVGGKLGLWEVQQHAWLDLTEILGADEWSMFKNVSEQAGAFTDRFSDFDRGLSSNEWAGVTGYFPDTEFSELWFGTRDINIDLYYEYHPQRHLMLVGQLAVIVAPVAPLIAVSKGAIAVGKTSLVVAGAVSPTPPAFGDITRVVLQGAYYTAYTRYSYSPSQSQNCGIPASSSYWQNQ